MAEAVIGRGLVEIVPSFKTFGKELAASMARARAQLDGTAAGLRTSAGTVLASMTKVGKGASLVGIGVAAASVKMAGDFQAETAVLQTAAGETAKNLGLVRKGILSISTGTGTGIKNLTDGMYTIEKAGFRGANGLMILKAAAQGAKEENANLSDVTNAMTSVMASYHLQATDATRVMNSLKTAAGEGKITMEEFSGALSTVLPIASANKISLAEVGGAIATLTQHGTSAREATQELAATIRQLAAPNNVAVHEMARFGLSAQDVATKLGTRGLSGTIDILTNAVLTKMGPSGKVLLSAFNNTKAAGQAANDMLSHMPKSLQAVAKEFLNGKVSVEDWKKQVKGLPVDQANLVKQFATLVDKNRGFSDELRKGGPASKTYTEAIKKMSGGAIGLNTVLQLSGESTEGYHERIKKVSESYKNASKDVEGWKVTQGLFNTQLARMKQTVQVLMIEIGTKLIPILQSMAAWMLRNKDVVIVLAGVIAGVLTLSIVAFAAKTVVSAGKVVLSFAKMGASAVMMGANFVRGISSASAAASQSTGLAGSLGGAIRKGLSPSTYASAFTTLRLRGMYAVDAVKSGFKAAGTAASTMATTIKTAAVSAGTAAWSGITSGAKAVGLAMKSAALATRDFAKAQYESVVANAKAAVAWTIAKTKTLAQAAATAIATAAQWLWNIAMDANPITLIIIGIAALVAAIVWIATKTTWFQTVWRAAWGAITTAFSATWNFIKDHWKLILGILLGPIGGAVYLIDRYWKNIASGARAAVSFIRDHWVVITSVITGPVGAAVIYVVRHWNQIVDGAKAMMRNLITWFSGLPKRIASSLGNLGSLLSSKGHDVINGFLSGMKTAFKDLAKWVTGIAGWIKDHKGPLSLDASLLRPAGEKMMEGFLKGLKIGFKGVGDFVYGVAGSVADVTSSIASKIGGVAKGVGKGIVKVGGSIVGAVNPFKFDNGGWLPPGLSLTMNGTGKPERIRTAAQESALSGSGGDTYVFQFSGPVGSQRELENWLVAALDSVGQHRRVPASFKQGR